MPLKIRAHNVLCLQGFKGHGYSPEFIANAQRISETLKLDPATTVRIIVGPDSLCQHCLHLDGDVCVLNPVPATDSQVDQATLADRTVLQALGLEESRVYVWSEILSIIGKKVSSTSMNELCGDCMWRAFPFCAEALDSLHSDARPTAETG
jgi:hypothetical protein